MSPAQLPAGQVRPLPPAGTEIGADTLGASLTNYSAGATPYTGTTAKQENLSALYASAVPRMGSAARTRGIIEGSTGILGQTAQMVPALIKTSAERENLRALQALQRKERQGKLGLSESEVAMYQRQLMEPVRGMAREQRMAEEARAASDPTAGRSAAALARGQREGRRMLREAGQEAGKQVVAADLQRVAAQRQEIQERIAAQGREERRRLNVIGQTIGALGKPVGQLAASIPSTAVDENTMRALAQQYGPDEALRMAYLMRSMNAGDRRQFIAEATKRAEVGK